MNESSTSTSSRGTKVLGVATLVSGALLVAYAFVFSGADIELGNTVRILYLHVPTVVVAYLCILTNAVASGVYLWRRTAFPDLLAAATGELATVLLGLTLVTGALWGRPTWGTYWSWQDPRLTSTLLMFLMYVGYVTVRNIPAPPSARGTRSAVVGIVSSLMIVPVHMSTSWWSSLHQGRTLGAPGESNIHGAEEFAVYLGFSTFMLLAAWLTMHRFRVLWLADQVAAGELEGAIASRRDEGRDGLGLGEAST